MYEAEWCSTFYVVDALPLGPYSMPMPRGPYGGPRECGIVLRRNPIEMSLRDEVSTRERWSMEGQTWT